MTVHNTAFSALHASEGERYVFISYSHRDQQQALSIIRAMQQAGISLWYDRGINPGAEWDEEIAGRIDGCGCMISIVSRNYLASDNCKDELKYARDLQKDILILYIEECTLPSGLALRINRKQAIMRHRYETEQAFHDDLLRAGILQKYTTAAPAPRQLGPSPEKRPAAAIPAQIVSSDQLQLGYLAADSATAIGVDRNSLRKRLLICGPATEQRRRFICQMLLSLYQSGESFLILSAGATQYRSLLSIVPDLQIFTPGRESVQPFPFNPFISRETRRLPLGQMVTRIAHTLQLSMALSPQVHTVLISAIRQCARRFGMGNHDTQRFWDEDNVRLFSLRDVLCEYKRIVQEQYTGEEAAALMAACSDQLQEYMNQNSDVLDRVYSTPVESLLDVPTLIELGAMPGVESRAMLMRLLMHYIYLLRRQDNSPADHSRRLVILIDGLDTMLDSSDEEMDDALLMSRQVALRHLLRELETTGCVDVICVAESLQLAGRHILQDMAEKIVLGNEDDARQLLHQPGDVLPGIAGHQALLLSSGKPPVAFEPDLLDERFCAPISDRDVAARVCYWEGNQQLLRRYQECGQCLYCREGCDPAIRATADEMVVRRLFRKAGDIAAAMTAPDEHGHDEWTPAELPYPDDPGSRQRFISCFRIRMAKELAARNLRHAPLSADYINRLTAASITDYTDVAGPIPIGLDETGSSIVRWDINLANRTGQQCFSIRWEDPNGSVTYEKELHAVLTQVSRFCPSLTVLSWENAFMRATAFDRCIYGTQAVEQISAMYREAAARAQLYRQNPDDAAQLEDRTWVIHLTQELLDHLPRELNLRVLTHFTMPIRMRIIYLLPHSFHIRDYEKEIPAENGIVFGSDNLKESRRLKEANAAGSLLSGNQSIACRFICE